MNKKLVVAIVSVFLAVIILFGGVWFLFLNKESSNRPVDISRFTIPGEALLNTSLTEVDAGTVPEGWDKTFAYPFLRDAEKSTCLYTEGGNKNHVGVTHKDDRSSLNFYGRHGAHILTLPEIEAENFLFSFDLGFKNFKTPFGVALGLDSNYKESTSATLFTLSGVEQTPDDDTENIAPCFSIFKATKNKNSAEADRLDFKIADFAPEAVVINNAETGEGTIPFDVTINIKICRYDSRYYFYLNDRPVYDLAIKNDRKDSARLGFFSDTECREVMVYDIKVSELLYAPDRISDFFLAYNLLNEDFSNISGELPADWKHLNAKWLEDSDKSEVLVKDKKLSISSAEGSAAVILPRTEYTNTCTTVTLNLESTTGEIGFIDNISSPLNSTRGGCFSTFIPSENKTRHYTQFGGVESNLKEYNADQTVLTKPGSDITFKIYNLGGQSFFFINDTFISYNTTGEIAFEKHFSGIFTKGNGGITVSSVRVDALTEKGVSNGLTLTDYKLTSKADSVGLEFSLNFNKNNVIYKGNSEGLSFGAAALAIDTAEPVRIDSATKGAIFLEATDITDNNSVISFNASIDSIPKENLNKYYSVMGYVSLKTENDTLYFYGEPTVTSPAILASEMYLDADSALKNSLDTLFEGCSNYVGKFEKSITFGVFSDFHYKANMYSTSIKDLESIFERAHKAGASFMLSGGDFCNDFIGSPELTNAFLKNKYDMPVYNIYGNHELESSGNSMRIVTPLLTNDKKVVWGTASGKIGDGSIGYYYADREGFRIVGIDTNYSYNPLKGVWEHNYADSYGAPSGNTAINSLGPDQLVWLEDVLTDAARKGLPCIIIGHDSMAGQFRSTSPDAAVVRQIYEKVNNIRKGTVLISINGHIHTNNLAVVDDVLYLDMNTTRNGVWRATGAEHYTAEHTFNYVEYDAQGNPVAEYEKSLGELSMGKNTWFFADPLSAVITVSQYGSVTVEGMESSWIYNVVPQNYSKDEVPMVSSGKWELVKNK